MAVKMILVNKNYNSSKSKLLVFSSLLLTFIGVTVVKRIIQVSGVHFRDVRSVCCTVWPPPRVRPSSVTTC